MVPKSCCSSSFPGTRARLVCKFDLVDVDVPPAAALGVDDLDACLFALEFLDVEALPLQLFVVLALGGADDLAVDEQTMQVLSWPPPPIRKLMNRRSMVKAGLVSLPWSLSLPPRYVLTSP